MVDKNEDARLQEIQHVSIMLSEAFIVIDRYIIKILALKDTNDPPLCVCARLDRRECAF